ncbi:TPM domain-containing protein [Clostridium sp. CX1]|uniref:TPM domain-containing protein n=1 Tax=Clostridium tanneri TaxID=3037988 RepID=A0ABU4JUP9_9CLOT|nr:MULTISPECIES: TPM domain-containing protein [unclassified Clostridium]MCT8976652.1 TPM domain-containing protein [Clostridium sp. CX1]MDW8801865.1 TPM domain-containing protein [Clostridium sp. A1-XYC3]
MNRFKKHNRLINSLCLNKLFINIIILTLLLIFPLTCVVKGASNIPEWTSLKYVNDYAAVIDENTKNYIVSIGRELEEKTGAQMTVVVINSLEGSDIESYANKLFRSWGIGQKDKDNGLLILLSMQDRKWRIELGRGLEGFITDIYSARVMDNVAKPLFREGKYGEGLKNVYSTFAADIAKENNITLENKIQLPESQNVNQVRSGNPSFIYIILGLVFLDVVFNRARIIRFLLYGMFWNSFWGGGPRGGGGGFGGGSGGFGGGSGGGGFGGGTSGGGGSSGDW